MPTELEIALGDKNTVTEDSAFGAYRTLQEAKTNPDLANSPHLETSRLALKSYVDERSKYGHELFPNVLAQQNKKRNEYLAGLYTKPLDQALDADTYANIDKVAKYTNDPEEFKQRAANRAYLSAVSGADIPLDKYDLTRTVYAQEHLGLSADTSDKAVFSAIQTRFKEQ